MALLDDAKAIRVGATAAKAVYAGSTLVWPKTPGTPSRPRVSNPAHSTCTLSWDAVPDATAYEVRHQHNETAGNIMTTVASPTCNVTGMTHNSHFDFHVRTKRVIGSNTLYSPWGPKLRYNTGQPEARKNQSVSYEDRPLNSGTYRRPDGWAHNGTRVAQGFYNNSSYTAFGHWTYNAAKFQNWIRDNYGADVLPNISWNFWRVAIYRNSTSSTGDGGARTINWWVSPGIAHQGGEPAMSGGAANGVIGLGQADWFNAGAGTMHWAKHVLMNENIGGGAIHSFAHYHGGSHDYMIFLGHNEAGNAGNLYIEISWNFVTQAYVAPTWQNV